MYRFMMVLLLGLSASTVGQQPADAASVQVDEGWPEFCAQFKTQSSCNAAGSCVWYYGRCAPTWE